MEYVPWKAGIIRKPAEGFVTAFRGSDSKGYGDCLRMEGVWNPYWLAYG